MEKDNGTTANGYDRELLIEHAKSHLADLIPYDDPNYEERLQAMAESWADYEIHGDPEFDELCRHHDELLEAGEIDF